MTVAVLDPPLTASREADAPARRKSPSLPPVLRNRAAWRTIRMMDALERIAVRFNKAGVDVMVLKGAALNLTLYDTPGERPMDDLDLMVRPEDAARAGTILESCGAVRTESQVREDFFPRFVYEVHYTLGTIDPVTIDLHVRPFRPLRYSRTVPPEALWSEAVPVRVGRATVLHPSPEDMLLHLLVHSAVHGHSRAVWIEDVRRWIQRYDRRMNWDRFFRSAREWRLEQPVREACERVESDEAPRLPVGMRESMRRLRGGWRDRMALRQAPRDHDHPVRHVLVNAICTPGWRFVFAYLWAVVFPGRTYMRDRYRGGHVGWLPTAHVLRCLGPGGRAVQRMLRLDAGFEVKPSPVHGIGIFARYDFEPGQTIAQGASQGVTGDQRRSTLSGGLRLLNHSCAPNAVFDGSALRALTPIAAGMGITVALAGASCQCAYSGVEDVGRRERVEA